MFGFCWLAIKAGVAKLPQGAGWGALYGAALLCGVGFTMSLFIGSLAFEYVDSSGFDERIGIVFGSLVSAVLGYLVLRRVLPAEQKD